MSTLYRVIYTDYGLAAIAAAISSGTPINLTQVAVGDGNGVDVTPSQSMTSLVHEVYRAAVNTVEQDPAEPTDYYVEMIIPSTVGGWTIREFGIYDDHGNLFAVGNYPDTYKTLPTDGATSDLAIRAEILVQNAGVITVMVDPNVAVASRAWVTNNITVPFLLPGGTTHQVLRKKSNADGDTEWADVTDVNVIVQVVQEIQTIAAGQMTFNLATCTTDGLSVHVGGALIPKRAGAGGWQTGTPSGTQVVLGTQYPVGTEVVFLQNEPASTLTVPLDQSKNLSDVLDKAAARTNLDIYSKAETDQKAPAGMVAHFAMLAPPTGWLKANGALVSRTAYATLFAAIGTTFGAGDGSTTFALPDLRGEFLRGLDDGRGVDPGRLLGTFESSQNLSHSHTGTSATAGSHSHTGSTSAAGDHAHSGSTSAIGDHTHSFSAIQAGGIQSGNSDGRYSATPTASTTGAAGGHSHSITTNTAGSHSHSITTSTTGDHNHTLSIDANGGTEARPRNIALLVCIKY
jgi:phage-related tail fiber protein